MHTYSTHVAKSAIACIRQQQLVHHLDLHIPGLQVQSHLEFEVVYDRGEQLHPAIFERCETMRRHWYCSELRFLPLEDRRYKRQSLKASVPLHKEGEDQEIETVSAPALPEEIVVPPS